jgi:hypothetical protein
MLDLVGREKEKKENVDQTCVGAVAKHASLVEVCGTD